MDWYVLTLMATGLYTMQSILLKFAATKKCDKNLTTFFHLLTVTVISLPILLIQGVVQITSLGIFFAIVNGVFYAINRIARTEALKHIPLSIMSPILRLNNVVVVILFILFLGESITLSNSIGIVLAVISLFLLSGGEGP